MNTFYTTSGFVEYGDIGTVTFISFRLAKTIAMKSAAGKWAKWAYFPTAMPLDGFIIVLASPKRGMSLAIRGD